MDPQQNKNSPTAPQKRGRRTPPRQRSKGTGRPKIQAVNHNSPPYARFHPIPPDTTHNIMHVMRTCPKDRPTNDLSSSITGIMLTWLPHNHPRDTFRLINISSLSLYLRRRGSPQLPNAASQFLGRHYTHQKQRRGAAPKVRRKIGGSAA